MKNEYFESLNSPEFCSSKSLNALDLVKFIMALAVVWLHSLPFQDISPFLNSVVSFGVCRLAVPFFFVTSAWLLFRRIKGFDGDHDYVTPIFRNAKRLLIMYGIWTVIYIPWMLNLPDISHSVPIMIINILTICEYSHLWYLIASVYGLLIIAGLLKLRVSPDKIFAMSMVAFIVGLLFSSYNELLNMVGLIRISDIYFDLFFSVRNGLLFAFPYMAAGLMLSVSNIRIKKKMLFIIFGILYLLHLCEFVVIRKFNLNYSTDMSIFAMPLVVVMVYLAIHIKLKDRKIYKIARECSTLIFFMQFYMIDLFTKVLVINHSFVRYIVICITSVMISLIILKLEKYKQFKFLRYLH